MPEGYGAGSRDGVATVRTFVAPGVRSAPALGTLPRCRSCGDPLGYDARSLRELRCPRCKGEHRQPLTLPVEDWPERNVRRRPLEALDAVLASVEAWNLVEPRSARPLLLAAAARRLGVIVRSDPSGPQLHAAILRAQADWLHRVEDFAEADLPEMAEC